MRDNRPPSDEQWETFVRDTAKHFPYPPTPDVYQTVRQPSKPQPSRAMYYGRLAAAALLVIVLAAMAVPEVRAAVLEVLRIGAVRIFLIEPENTPTPHSVTATPTTPSPVFDLPGETSLALVRARLQDQLRLPTELGEPNRVFLQYLGGPVVTLVWVQPHDPNIAQWVLQILDRDVSASKEMYQGQTQSVTVNGRRGIWLEDVHEIVFYGVNGDNRRLVEAHVLVWEIDGITYRLETAHPLEEALRVAESVR